MKNPFTQTDQQRLTTGMLVAMANLRKPMYEGTVDPAVTARRRAQNKAARRARAIHRKAAR